MKENTKELILFTFLVVVTLITVLLILNFASWMPQNKHVEFVNSDNLLMVYYKSDDYDSGLENQIERIQIITIYDKFGMSFESAQNHINKISDEMDSETYKLVLTSFIATIQPKESNDRSESWFIENELSKAQERDYVSYELYYSIINK